MLMSKQSLFHNDIISLNRKTYFQTLLYVFAFGLTAHGFCFFNGNFSHDSITFLNSVMLYPFRIGRFARPLYHLFRGTIASPVLGGVLSLFFTGSAVYLLLSVLHIRNHTAWILSCGILTTNYTLTSLYSTFMHDADCYAFAFLLVMIGMFYSVINRKITAVFFYTLSLGLYQSYIQIPITAFMILSIDRIFESDDCTSEIKNVISNFFPIAVSMIIYFIIHKSIMYVLHLSLQFDEPNSYNSISQAYNLSFHEIMTRMSNALTSEKTWLLHPNNYHSIPIGIINLCILFISQITATKICIERKMKKNSFLFVVSIIVIMPFAMNIIGIISGVSHHLTHGSFFLLYLLPFVLLEKSKCVSSSVGRLKTEVLLFVLFEIIIFDNIVYSNSVYVKKDLEAKSTLSVMTRVLDRIEQTDGYIPNHTKIAIVGNLDDSPITGNRNGFDYGLTGSEGHYASTYYDTYRDYFKKYLGYAAIVETADICKQWEQNEKVINMPSFPNKGCCQMFGDTIVVKLSESGKEKPELTYASIDSINARISQQNQSLIMRTIGKIMKLAFPFD